MGGGCRWARSLAAATALLAARAAANCVSRPFVDPPVADRVMNDWLVERKATRVVHRFGATDASRYLTVVEVPRGSTGPFGARCGDRHEVLLLSKQGEYPHCNKDSWTTLYAECDAGLRTCGDPAASCVANGTVVHHDKKIDHNLGCLLAKNGSAFFCVGGMLKTRAHRTAVLSAPDRDALASRGLSRVNVDGFGSLGTGCIDLRVQNYPKCEFDGRFSLAQPRAGPLAGQTFLSTPRPRPRRRGENVSRKTRYARANMAPLGGGRYLCRCRR